MDPSQQRPLREWGGVIFWNMVSEVQWLDARESHVRHGREMTRPVPAAGRSHAAPGGWLIILFLSLSFLSISRGLVRRVRVRVRVRIRRGC